MKIEMTTKTIKEKISTTILNFIRKENVNYIFGMQGGYTVGFGDEIHNFDDIHFIHCQHEEGAAFMADGYAKASGKFGVVLTTAGTGLSNTFTGIISSFADGIPILLISGAIPRDKIFKGAIQDTESFRMNIFSSFKETTKFQADIIYKENFLQYFRSAIRYLFKGKLGPVFLNISSDIFSQEIERKFEYFRHFENSYFDKIAADESIKELKKSKSAIIIVGYGVTTSQAKVEVEKLTNLLKIPVLTTPKGKSSINNESDFHLGVFGVGANLIPLEYLKNEKIDTIIAIGTSFNEYSSSAWSSYLSDINRIIQIDIDPYIIGRSFTNTFGIIGDAKNTVMHLNECIKKEPEAYAHLNSEIKIKHYKQNVKNVIKPELETSDAVPIKPPRLLKDIFDSFYSHDLNVFNDNGSCIFLVGHYFKLRKNWDYNISLGFSSMGYAIPAAIGGALGNPKKVTIAIAGDGATIMNGNELKTASEYNVPLFIFVLNDGALGIVHHSTKILCNRANPGTKFNSKIDFVKFAESLGVEAYKISEPGQINKTFIDELIAKNKPILFDCWIDPEELAPYADRIKQVKK